MSMDWTRQARDAAAEYHRSLVPAIFVPSTEALLEAVPVHPGDRVLDVACGTGVVTREAARWAGADGRVLGVDLGEPMLEVARAQPAAEGAAPIEYRQGDAQALPVEDASFDVVLCQHGVMFFPDRAAAAAQFARAVRPGGTVGLAAWCSTDENPAFGALTSGLAAHVSEEAADMMRTPFSVGGAELGALLDGAGLDDVSVTRVEFGAHFGAPREYAASALLANPAGALFRAAPQQSQEALRDHVAERLVGFVGDDGRAVVPAAMSIATGRRAG